MLKLSRLKLENFLSHKDTSIDLESKKGLVLISGRNNSGLYDSNGSGKSTILEGIVYAITGDTLRGLSANEVVNRNAKKNTKVSLSFFTDAGEYRIDRYRKDSINGDKIDLWDVGEDVSGNISKRLNRDTQSLIDNIIDIPYEVLKNTIFLGEGLSSRFTQLSDPAKKSLIESTLSLSYDLGKCKDMASAQMKELKLEKSNKEGQLMTLQGLLSEIPSDNSESKESYDREIAEGQRVLDQLIKDRDEIQCMIPAINSKLELIKSSISEYNLLYSKLQNLDIETADIVNHITHIESSESPECTLCHQKLVSQESKDSIIASYREKFNINTSQMKEWQESLDSMPDISILNQKLDELQRMLNEYNISLNHTYGQITIVSSSIERSKAKLQSLLDLQNNLKVYESQVEDVKSSITGIEKDLWRYEYFYKLFSPTGMITYILEDAISYINERIRVYTDILLDKTYKLVLSKGKISLEDDRGSTYQSLSNGEKRRLDIAIQFSLHDYTHIYCGIGTNLLFIDEVLDTLDATGVNNIIEVLNLKRDYCKLDSIYVITHNNDLKSYFDDVITVTKDSDGNSYIM